MNKILNVIYYQIATVLGVGNIKYAPGTWGSLLGFIFVYIFYSNMLLYSLFFILTFVAGVISSDYVEKNMGVIDPKQVIIDEFSCVFAIFFFIPENAINIPLIITAFALYRILDIFKIPPINLFERLKGGFGIMMDDLACGILTGLLLRLLISFKIFVK